ncbi:MAG: hypothetical protein AMXMBFR84_07320 [Candidatus Hydrogenedentota bacterium]
MDEGIDFVRLRSRESRVPSTMETPHRSVVSVLTFVRDELASLSRQLGALTPYEVSHAVPELDTRLRRVYEGLEACRKYVALHRPPECRYYKPAETIRSIKGTLSASPFTIDVQANRECYGDPDQIGEILKIMVRSLPPTQGGVTVELLLASVQPKIVVSVDGEARFPETFVIEGMIAVTLREMGRCWIGATHGGHIHEAADGAVLYLEGNATVPDQNADMSALQVPLDVATRKLTAWRGAIGQYEEGLVAPEEVITLYAKNVDQVLELVAPAVDAARSLEL